MLQDMKMQNFLKFELFMYPSWKRVKHCRFNLKYIETGSRNKNETQFIRILDYLQFLCVLAPILLPEVSIRHIIFMKTLEYLAIQHFQHTLLFFRRRLHNRCIDFHQLSILSQLEKIYVLGILNGFLTAKTDSFCFLFRSLV